VAEAAAVAAIRAQRVEVDALLAFRAAAPGTPAAADAWWRLQAARREAVTGWQALRHRLGLLRWENAATPARFAHGQPARARG
jgi:hypothetical protein